MGGFVRIYPSFDLPTGQESSYRAFAESIGQLIQEILPPQVLDFQDCPEEFAKALEPILPLIRWSRLQKGGNAFNVSILCKAQYSHGTGRFLSDVLSRRLIPGKTVELGGTRTLSFFFHPDSNQEYLINERFVVETEPESVDLIEKNMPILARELQLTLLSIYKARHFLSIHPKITEARSAILAELQHLSVFEEMHQIISRLSAEKTKGEIRKSLAPVYLRRPQVFDRDIIEEIKPFIAIYNEQFIGSRGLRYMARLICCHYFFKKQIEKRSQEDPLSRQILIKPFRQLDTVGILVAINLFGENEVLKKHHLIEAVRSCLPHFEIVSNSFAIDVSSESRPIFYLEANKKEGGSVSSQEILALRTHLPSELQQSIQRVLNPLFMPRNEEDQLRLIISLSRELCSSKDIPQVAISFEEQTFDELSFSVVLLRVQKKSSPPIRDLLANLPYKIQLREAKTVGMIRNQLPKELIMFSAFLPKRPFLRKDHSLDLPKARQELLSQLKQLFKEVRDFNGGLLSKQLENLQSLKELLGPCAHKNGFLLENFFFSLEPPIAQTSTPPALLKTGFLTLLKLIGENLPYEIIPSTPGVSACFIEPSPSAKERFLSLLETEKGSFQPICRSSIIVHDLHFLTVFLSSSDTQKQREFDSFLRAYLGALHPEFRPRQESKLQIK